ncbi:N-acyl-D-amino-acid deacylase family protein [Phenylobacterium sp.]|uniref:N-acyl-D-amino-acid deacylase family protein n=1 Tax=Phenylobacterium sp. TaxID=1871053 RepID=UPI002F4173BC
MDGSGGQPFEADVAVSGGKIAAVGRVLSRGREEIDAKGRLVTPGYVDVHTHYDGQVTWDNRLAPSSGHGVTTVVIGNCGVGFAPCRPEQRDALIRLMEGVEDIPKIVLADGIPWEWESYPQMLDFLAARRFDADVASYVPHAALRTYVLGDRALAQEASTEAEIAEMGRILHNAVEAGALGFGTSQTLFHRASDGSYTPTLAAGEAEYTGLALALKEAGRGVMQFVVEWTGDWRPRFEMMRRLAERSGRPVTFALTQNHEVPTVWSDVLDAVTEANKAPGVDMTLQVLPRPLGVLLGLELTLNPFYSTETYRRLADLPLAARVAELRKPEVKARILAENNDPSPLQLVGLRVRNFEQLFELADPLDYEPLPDRSIGAQAGRLGVSPESLAYDKLLERDGRNMLYLAFANYADFSLDPTRAMLMHPNAVPGLGDGGAHLGTICDASTFTYMLTHWARDRRRGPKLPIERLVHLLTRAGAEAVGLRDRGLVRPGYRADLNVIDFDRLQLRLPRLSHDLPAGGRRLMQDAEGYDATIVAGRITRRGGEATSELPGRLVRGQQPEPAAAREREHQA